MCRHKNKRKVGDVWVCFDCGLTTLPDGKFIIDKSIVNYKPKRKGEKKCRQEVYTN